VHGPVAGRNCLSCHMPKIYDPDMHYTFTDHRIRIVHPGEPKSRFSLKSAREARDKIG
jgi:formate-dependent nitrite reductase cytochrome c552 subunit